MSKYASGTSVKTVIKNEVKAISAILKKPKLSKEDKADIVDAFKEISFQWCTANATSCAVEQAILTLYGEEERTKVIKEAIRNGVHEEVMDRTWPY